MTTDMEMKNYVAALRDAERELAGMHTRRRKLEATIASLRALVDSEEQETLGLGADAEPSTNGKRPAIPPSFFKGKKATQAYRDFVRLWGGDHPPPRIRDLMIEGGMEAKSKTHLLNELHSVIRRERIRQEKEEGGEI